MRISGIDTLRQIAVLFLLPLTICLLGEQNKFSRTNLKRSPVSQPENRSIKTAPDKIELSFGSAIICSVTGNTGTIHSGIATVIEITKQDSLSDITAAEMVLIEGGKFMMGNNEEEDEKPLHEVILNDFYMGKYEVTQKEWLGIMGNNPSKFKGENLPVENISWNDAQEFIKKLNAKTGEKYRLPTEAEWEYAARGGRFANEKLNNPNELTEVAWFEANSEDKTHTVGSKKPNALGLFDMSGNVWEWCEDWYHPKYYSFSRSQNPTGPGQGFSKTLRGGSWYSGRTTLRMTGRNEKPAEEKNEFSGLRLCQDVKKEEVFIFADEMPHFPGGNEALVEFIEQNTKYPLNALQNQIEGKVYVAFCIDKKGKIYNVEVVKGIGYGCDEEAMRVVSLLPDWESAKIKGKPVNIKVSIPIVFKIR